MKRPLAGWSSASNLINCWAQFLIVWPNPYFYEPITFSMYLCMNCTQLASLVRSLPFKKDHLQLNAQLAHQHLKKYGRLLYCRLTTDAWRKKMSRLLMCLWSRDYHQGSWLLNSYQEMLLIGSWSSSTLCKSDEMSSWRHRQSDSVGVGWHLLMDKKWYFLFSCSQTITTINWRMAPATHFHGTSSIVTVATILAIVKIEASKVALMKLVDPITFFCPMDAFKRSRISLILIMDIRSVSKEGCVSESV